MPKADVLDGFKKTEVGLIPEEWDVVKIKDCGEIITGTTPSTSNQEYYGGPYMLISPADLGDRIYVTNSQRKITEKGLAKSRVLPKHSVLVTCIGSIGKTGITSAEQSACNQQINAIICNPKTDSHFLYFLFNQIAPVLDARAVKTTLPILNKSNFEQIPVFLPPLPEQHAIAHVLSKIQAAAEIQANIAERARELKRALMAKLFTEGLRGEPLKETEIGLMPEGWEVIKLGERVTVQSGGTPSRSNSSYWGGKIAWVKTGEINYKVITDTEEKITEAGLANSSARLVPAGTLLMAMYGQGVTRGRVAILGIEATTNQACAALVPNETLTTDYLYVYLSFAYERVRNLGHGAQQTNLSGEIIKTIKLPVPSLDEQKEIVCIMQTVDAKIETAERKRAMLDELFRAMLEQLMTGRVRTTGLSV